MNQSASANGGTSDINPVQDHGFIYGRDFTDPDGHVWGVMWMDLPAMPPREEAQRVAAQVTSRRPILCSNCPLCDTAQLAC